MADQMKEENKKTHQTPTALPLSSNPVASNFEYDNENEWDVGIGDLIIDLDADIEKNTGTTNLPLPSSTTTPSESSSSTLKVLPTDPLSGKVSTSLSLPTTMAVEHSSTVDKGLKMKIKRTQKPSGNKQHEIVKQPSTTGASSANIGNTSTVLSGVENGSDNQLNNSNTNMSNASQNKKQNIGPNSVLPLVPSVQPSTPGGTLRKGDKKSISAQNNQAQSSTTQLGTQPHHISSHCDKTMDLNASVIIGTNTPGPPSTILNSLNSTSGSTLVSTNISNSSTLSSSTCPGIEPQDVKKIKTEQKDTTDVCVGTSVATITEPDCLGPCEPGTSVTLEGIVWHETEGVLVVNVTWRGKTYVGTLLDCTRHDWAPPRLCDSPTSDLDARTTKNSSGGGRTSKRGRNLGSNSTSVNSSNSNSSGSGGNSIGFNDLSNFTETRSSVHSKLRSNSAGSNKNDKESSSTNGEKGGKDKGKRNSINSNDKNASGTSSPTPFVLPRPDKRKASNSKDDKDASGNTPTSSEASSNKKSRTTSLCSPPPSPVLLECPDPNCSKKYKHINGLKYHQSHAHAANEEDNGVSNSTSETEPEAQDVEENTTQPSPPQIVDNVLNNEHLIRLPTDVSSQSHTQPSPSQPLVAINPPAAVLPSVSPVAGAPLTPQPQKQPPTFKIKSPSSLLADVNIDSPDLSKQQLDLSIPNNSLSGIGASPSSSQLHKKKRKHDDLNVSITQNVPGGIVENISLHNQSREDITSPAYSDISDDDTSKKPTLVQPAVQPPSGPGPEFNVFPQFYPNASPVPSGGAGSQLPPGGPSAVDKLDNKDLIKKSLTVGAVDGDATVGDSNSQPGGNPPPPAGGYYFPYGFPPGYPYANVAQNSSVAQPGGPPGNVNSGGNLPLQQPDQRILSQTSGPPPTSHGDEKHTKLSNPGDLSQPQIGSLKDKAGPNENHQILKESIEVKNQMLLPGNYQPRQTSDSRFYLYNNPTTESGGGQVGRPRKDTSHSSQQNRDLKPSLKEIKKEEETKDQGVKPTMETQGPPPAPTSQQFAYIHAGYMQPPYHAYDAGVGVGPPHPMYRGAPHPMHVLPGHYLHPSQLHARYPPTHVPEDLSTPNAGKGGIEMFYTTGPPPSSHKIHELQERAMKSPNSSSTKAVNTGGSAQNLNLSQSPSSIQNNDRMVPNTGGNGPSTTSTPTTTSSTTLGRPNNSGTPPHKDVSRSSPPPQRHVHTHHHTHVGLGYSILASQYPPYGSTAVQAVINQYPPTTK